MSRSSPCGLGPGRARSEPERPLIPANTTSWLTRTRTVLRSGMTLGGSRSLGLRPRRAGVLPPQRRWPRQSAYDASCCESGARLASQSRGLSRCGSDAWTYGGVSVHETQAPPGLPGREVESTVDLGLLGGGGRRGLLGSEPEEWGVVNEDTVADERPRSLDSTGQERRLAAVVPLRVTARRQDRAMTVMSRFDRLEFTDGIRFRSRGGTRSC